MTIRTLTILLCATLTNAARAGPSTKDGPGPKAVDLAVALGVEPTAHLAQTLLLLWIVAGITGAAHEQHLRPLTNVDTDLLEVLTSAGEAMTNSFGVYAAILGAGTTGGTAKILLELKDRFGAECTPHAFAKYIRLANLSFVSFVGWEAGSRLWTDSIDDLAETDPHDVNTALALPVLTLLRGGGTADQRRVFGLVLKNALDRLLNRDSERTQSWLRNTLRLNILTGRFFVTLAAMAGTGAVTGAVFGYGPVGAVAGVVTGTAAAVAVHYLPDHVQQSGTDGFRRARLSIARNHLDRNAEDLAEVGLRLADFERPPEPADVDALSRALERRSGWRDTAATALIEQIYDAVTTHQNAEVTLDAIKERRLDKCAWILASVEPDDALGKLRREFTKAEFKSRRRATAYLTELGDVFANERTLIERSVDVDRVSSLPARRALRDHASGLERTIRGVRALSTGLIGDALTSSARAQTAANVLLNGFYLNGFRERMFKGGR